MRIRVDKMPEGPKDCLFVRRNVEYGYICPFQHSTCCLEHDGEKCPCLFDEEVENNGRA